MNPWAAQVSSSRMQMMGGHLSQALVIRGATTRRQLTGMERELGKTTFSVRMPSDAKILRVVEKYSANLSRGAGIRENPLVTVIYMDYHTSEIGVLDIPRQHCIHQHYGFPYKRHPVNFRKLVQDAHIPKGTVLADSPAIDEQGNVMIGTETQVAFMSVPGVIEDGVVVSRDYLQKLRTYGFEKRDVSWGERFYPLNLYGNEHEYKPFPDIGQKIRDDGLVFALREFDEMLGCVEMDPASLMKPDYTFDKCTYGVAGATVTDVSVWHKRDRGQSRTPRGMEAQAQWYYERQLGYYNTLISEWEKRRKHHAPTQAFQRLLVEAYTFRNDGSNRADQTYQGQPLDDWRVEVTFEYDVLPTIGYKITDFHGGKGVIVDIWETEDMPVDCNGVRAEAIMGGTATIKRMNIGRLSEQYVNATSAHLSREVQRMVASSVPEDQIWEYLLGYYKIIAPWMYERLISPEYRKRGGSPKRHIEKVVRNGIYLSMPPDNPAVGSQAIKDLMEQYPIPYGPVTYRGRSGRMVTTKRPIIIGSIYVMVLEKTSTFDWSAVSSAKLLHIGLPSKPPKQQKYSQPGRLSPVRLLGESEVRLVTAVCGGDVAADLLDMSNNPTRHKEVVNTILKAPLPSRIDQVLDRNQHPVGGSRSVSLLYHSLECAGVRLIQTSQNAVPDLVYYPKEDPNTVVQAEVDEEIE